MSKEGIVHSLYLFVPHTRATADVICPIDSLRLRARNKYAERGIVWR
jgi:hypothetical protein